MRKILTLKPNDFLKIHFANPAKIVKRKKGFTMVELVVVIAILSILAAIAIPVVASSTKNSIISKAKTNAHTIEHAFKEADAAAAMCDTTIYANADDNNIKISEVVDANKLKNVIAPENLFNTKYYPVFCKSKVYFACDSNNDGKFDTNDKDIDGTPLPDDAISLYDPVNNCIIEDEICNLPIR